MMAMMMADMPPIEYDSIDFYRDLMDTPMPEGTPTGYELWSD
jgi:hypothetical protein